LFEKATEEVLVQRRQQRRAKAYFNDPALWAKERAGIHLWSKQAEIAHSVAHNHDTVVKAGHGVGKSMIAAVLICWWMDTRWPDGRVASTAPSAHQIGAIVWYEVRHIFRLVEKRYQEGLTYAPLPGYITSENIWKTPEGDIAGFGRKPPDHKVDDAFQGIHSRTGYVLAIGDEAVGLDEEMIDALGNITSTVDSRRLLICNPTNPASYVAKIFARDMKNWSKMTISVFDNPNFTGEEVPKDFPLEALSDQSYVDSKKAEYGEGTARYRSRVLGEFAFDDELSLINTEDLAVAHDNDIAPTGERPVLGVDVARFGDDLSVIYSNDGGRIRRVDSWGQMDGMSTAKRIHENAVKLMASEVRIDGAGIGGPIIDRVWELRDLEKADYNIVEMMGGGAPEEPKEHYNARAMWWDNFRYALQEGRVDLDPEDEKLTDELMSVRYKFSTRQSMVIESKDDMRKRGLKSPDFADAVIYAYSEPAWSSGLKNGDKIALPVEDFSDYGYEDSVLDALAW
jgi:hypothetical protein